MSFEMECSLAIKLNNAFWSNLKVTFKFIGIVYFGLSLAIMSDAYRNENYEDLYFPLYSLAFLPIIFLGVFAYSKLKNSHINKYLCCMVFGSVISISTFIFYIVVHFIEASELDFRFISRMSVMAFVVMSLLYLQLPWKSDT